MSLAYGQKAMQTKRKRFNEREHSYLGVNSEPEMKRGSQGKTFNGSAITVELNMTS
jgi:hypothetical protein